MAIGRVMAYKRGKHTTEVVLRLKNGYTAVYELPKAIAEEIIHRGTAELRTASRKTTLPWPPEKGIQ